MSVRVRFAPSPTGFLHVGGARTALYNWLFARRHGGTFMLRIEDTDAQRSTGESVDAILDSMRWLGLDWDEGPEMEGETGPYFQSERLDLHRRYADRLLEMGRAYPCYCTSEELDARRKAALERGEPPKYDRKCLHLSEADRVRFEEEGRKAVIRLHAEDEGTTVVEDVILGSVEFENKVLDDFVLVKSDGNPTYNFAAVVDDALMEITHVIRGVDHLSNTPKQLLVYKVLEITPPSFAHIPMILGPDKKRLSKRHGATSVSQFRDEGYLPEAMLNYLALLGWGYDATQQLFSKGELVEKFSLDRVSKNPAVFDMKKLEWMNGVHLREASVERLVEEALPLLQGAGLVPARPDAELRGRVAQVVALIQDRIKTLADVVPWSRYYFSDELEFDPKAVKKHLQREDVPELLASVLKGLMAIEPFDEEHIEPVFTGLKERTGLGLGKVIQPVRVAVTGGSVSPGMYEVLALLGKAKSCQRIKEAAERAKEWRNRQSAAPAGSANLPDSAESAGRASQGR